MGYYTDYTVTANNIPREVDMECLVRDFRMIEEVKYSCSSYSFKINSVSRTIRFSISDVKWYTYKDDIEKISKKYPLVLIEVYGEGEESGDIWKEMFYAGETERFTPIMTWPESKLEKKFKETTK